MPCVSRHDCLFTGGPRDGEIHEVEDSTMIVHVNEFNVFMGGEPDVYVRLTTTQFVFQDTSAKSAEEETWRDRAIKDPIFW